MRVGTKPDMPTAASPPLATDRIGNITPPKKRKNARK